MESLLLSGLLIPLAGFLILMLLSTKIQRSFAGILACITIFLSLLCFIVLLELVLLENLPSIDLFLYSWLPIKGMEADIRLHLDHLSLLMALLITGIGFLIHVYSIGYMEHDDDFARYFACLNFFVFAMLLLVLAGDLLLLFVGWEGVGLASYLLIGFWNQRPAPAKAATKAFVINRIGDFGFLIALLLTFYLFGTTHITDISSQATQKFQAGAPVLALLTFLYFWGAIGKSAQLPLYTWLPDAMEGPTPVSALIHAATMVTAGVYLVVRMHPLFQLTPEILNLVGWVGGITALFASACALAQNDLKRVLAYSTISQLGLMFLACGAGAFFAAMFHLTTHAFVKALLFLSAGNVVHMMDGETNMDKMGGLSKVFNKTHWLFLIGVLALSGIPPLSPFFSKDLILEQEYLAGFQVLFWIGLIASLLTAFYLTRAYFLTFSGPSKAPTSLKEASSVMLIPVSLLAILAIFGGVLDYSPQAQLPLLEGFLKKDVEGVFVPPGFHLNLETLLAFLVGFIGVGAAALLYGHYPSFLPSPSQALKHSFYINELYATLFVHPLQTLSRWISQSIDIQVFQRFIEYMGSAAQLCARGLQKMQSGIIRSYFAWMALGTALLIIYFIGEIWHG